MFTIVAIIVVLSLILFIVASVSPRFAAWIKDTIKWAFICGVTAAVFVIACFYVSGASAENVEYLFIEDVDVYPLAAVVVSIDDDNIDLEDGEGNIWNIYWDFDEDPDIELGDIVALLMWDSGTPGHILDDEVVDAVNTFIKAE